MLAASGMAASAASGAASPSRPQATAVGLVYACRFPSGSRRTAVQISATFPAKAAAGGPIQPAGVTLAVRLPKAGVADLVKRQASAVRASAELTVGVAQGGKSATVVWPGLHVPATTVPRAGSMTLDASGAVPPLVVSGPGNVTLTAGGLVLALTLRTASAASPGPMRTASDATPSPSPSPGRTVAPPEVRIDCTPVADQVTTLATVAVTGAPGQAATSPKQAAAHSPFCPGLKKSGYKPNPRFPLPKPPPGSTIIFPTPLEPGCAYTGGYADVLKLNGAGLITPGVVDLDVNVRVAYDNCPPKSKTCVYRNYFQTDNYGQLSYHGLPEFPPSRTTFLAFGFEPVSATLHLIEIGTLNAVAIGPYFACPPACPTKPTVTTVSSYLYIRVTNVSINGVPLNVGADCGTAPFDAIVTGNSTSKPPYSVTEGGPVTGTIDIPPFTKCGVGENLDPLFTASISGPYNPPYNASLLTQGAVCFVLGGGTCSAKTGLPLVPKLLRSVVG
jgi:hypothetical protein